MQAYFPLGYIHFITFILYSLMAVFILRKDTASRINISAACMVSAFALWSLGLAIKHNPLTPQSAAVFAEHLGAFGWTNFPSFTLWFFLEISSQEKQPRRFFPSVLLFVPGVFFWILVLTNLLQSSPVYSPAGWYSPWTDSIFPAMFQFYYVLYIITALFFLLSYSLKNKNPVKKKQGIIIAIGTLFSIIIGSLSEVILPAILGSYGVLSEMSDIYIVVWAASVAYALIRLSVFKPNPENMSVQIVSQMNESLLILDETFSITYLNTSASNLLGIPEGSKENLDFCSIFVTREDGCRILKELPSANLWIKTNTAIKGVADKKIPASISITLIREKKEIRGAVCLLENTEEKTYFETTLKKEKELAEKYINTAGVFLLALDKDGLITLINKKGCEILGYSSKEELLGKNWFNDFIPKKTASATRLVFTKMSEHALIDGPVENYILQKNGTQRLMKWSNVVLSDEKGEFAGTLSSGEDITEAREKEEEMAKLVTAVEQSPSVIIISDLWGNITYVNPKFTEVTGYSRDEASGKNPRFLQAGDADKNIYKNLWETISSGKQWRGEFKNKKKDGSVYWESASISPIMDYKNRIFAYIAVKEDITEKRKQEEMLAQSYERLKEVDKLKTNFTSMVSHELRTPLTSIKGFISFLLGGVGGRLSPEQKEFVLIIKNNSERLLSLINDLLDLSKMEAGSFSISKRNTDIIPVIASSIRDIASIAEKKSINLKVTSPYTGYSINIDEYRISQVFINLLNNSIKFSPSGSEIEISLKEEKKNGKNLFGGLIIREGEHFLINAKDKYKSFKECFEDWEYFVL